MSAQDPTMRSPARHWLWLCVAVVAGVCMWSYVNQIWAFGQSAQFSDLYAPWWGARELLLHHRDPYSLTVCREIQTAIYGAPITGAQPGSAAERAGGFAYPLYLVFLMSPFAPLPFFAVRAIFSFLFPALVILAVALWLFAMKWRVEPVQFSVWALFCLGSFPVVQGLWLQNLSLLVAFLIAAGIAALAADHLLLAGVLLAFAAIKPHFIFLLLVWLAVWAAQDWRRRQRLPWSFLATLLVLILGSEWLSPGWIGRFIAVGRAYTQYTYAHSVLDVWLTSRIGTYVAAALAAGVLVVCWRFRRCKARSLRFVLACSLTLAATLVVIPTLEPHAQLLLMPGFLLLLQQSRSGWVKHRFARLLFSLPWMLLAWTWFSAAALTVALLWWNTSILQKFWFVPLSTSPLLPCGVLLALGCMFVGVSKAGECLDAAS